MRAAVAASMLVLFAVRPAHAQGTASGAHKECVVRDTGVVVHGEITTHFYLHSKDTTYVGGGVNSWCEGTDQRVIADSAEHYEDRKLLILIGHVHYTEARLKLDANRITYYHGRT